MKRASHRRTSIFLAPWLHVLLLTSCIGGSGALSKEEATDPDTSILVQRPAPLDDRPNILYIVLDQWRWDWAGYDPGTGISAPSLRALANEGTRFDHAYSPAPLCVPSRCAFAAGRSALSTWVTDNGMNFLPALGPTYMQLLQRVGYRTMIAGKDHLTDADGVGIDGANQASALGYDVEHRTNDKYTNTRQLGPIDPYGKSLHSLGLFGAQKTCYEGMGAGLCCNSTPVCQTTAPLLARSGVQECGFLCNQTSLADEEHDVDTWTMTRAKELIQEHHAGKHASEPWYMSVGFPSPHPPFILSPSMSRRARQRLYPGAADPGDLDPSTVLQARQSYGALVEKLDGLIGQLLDFLNASGLRENTLVMVTADHGEHLGDHGHFAKASAWDVATRVPLVVSGPGIARNRLVNAPVETLDLVGTMLDYAGAELAAGMETRSLKPFLTVADPELPRQHVRAGLLSRTEGSNFSSIVRQFNASSTLKLVCCPAQERCIKGGSLLPPSDPKKPVAALMRIGLAAPGDLENVLGTGQGCPEALDLVAHIPPVHRDSCKSALRTACPSQEA